MNPGVKAMKRWVVRKGDGATVGEVAARAGADADAIAEGRVFVGRRRAKSAAEPVKIGDEIGVHARRAGAASDATVTIVAQKDGMVAAIKPSGVVTVADHEGSAQAFVAHVAQGIRARVEELRVTSRLDREVSGVIVFATTAEAEARLVRARAEGRYARRYVAIATSASALPEHGTWNGAIGAGKDARHRAVSGKDAKEACTRFRVAARQGDVALLAVEPVTGRTHQIRVHSAHAGAPLFGDRDYGGPPKLALDDGAVVGIARIALHAARVTIPDAAGLPFVAEAPVPPDLARAWAELGGAPEAWNIALSCDVELASQPPSED